jgi:hypothetical protein
MILKVIPIKCNTYKSLYSFTWIKFPHPIKINGSMKINKTKEIKVILQNNKKIFTYKNTKISKKIAYEIWFLKFLYIM